MLFWIKYYLNGENTFFWIFFIKFQMYNAMQWKWNLIAWITTQFNKQDMLAHKWDHSQFQIHVFSLWLPQNKWIWNFFNLHVGNNYVKIWLRLGMCSLMCVVLSNIEFFRTISKNFTDILIYRWSLLWKGKIGIRVWIILTQLEYLFK